MRNSIRVRLTAAFIGSALVPLLAVGVIIGWQSYRTQQQQALDFQRQLAQRVSTTVTAFIQGLERELRVVVEVQDLQELPLDQQQRILSALLAQEGLFDELSLLDRHGREQIRLSRTRVFAPGDLSDRSQADEFRLPASSGQTYFSPVRFDEATGDPLMTIAVPWLDRYTGQVKGVLVTQARIKKIWEAVSDIQLGESGSVYIVDAQDRVIAHRNPSFVLRQMRFRPPGSDGIHTGLTGTSVVLAADSITFGQQVFTVVAEKPTLESLALAINTWVVIAVLLVISTLIAGGGFLVIRDTFRSIETLARAARAIASGDLSQVSLVRRDEIGDLALAFNTMTAQLRQTLEGLEHTVAERTAEVERHAAYLEAAAQVSRAASSILDADQLIQQTVDLIRQHFGLYHVGLFLLNETGRWADFRAGTGEAGRVLVEQRMRLEVGGRSMVGWCMANAQARVAQDVRLEIVRVDHPLLAETQSEVALPLIARGRVIGALNAQSDRRGAFDPATVAVLQTLADQIAVALDNARLFAESQAALEASRRAYGELSRRAWDELVHARAVRGYRCTGGKVAPLSSPGAPLPEMETALREGRRVATASAEAGPTLAVPLKVRDHVIGAIGLRKDAAGDDWTPAELALTEMLAERLNVALESARLYQDTQRRAARERLAGEITAHIRESLDMDTVLQTAIRELGDALRLTRVQVRMGIGPAPAEQGAAPPAPEPAGPQEG